MKPRRLAFLPPRWRKTLLWTGAAILVYTIIGFLLLPLVVRLVAVRQLSKNLGRAVTIRTVRFNPYTLSATIRDLLIKDHDGEPFISWDQVDLCFQFSSLFGKIWIFKEISLFQPCVRVRMNPDYTLNYADLAAQYFHTATTNSRPAGQPRALMVHRLRLINAKVSLTDLTPRIPFHRIIGPLDVTLPHFSTDPKSKNPYAFSGTTDGGERLAGRGYFYLAPFRSGGELSLGGVSLTNYAALYQDLIRFEVKDGVIHLRATYQYESSALTNLLVVTNTTLALQSLKLTARGTNENFVEIGNFKLEGASGDLLAHQAEVDAIKMVDARFVLRRNPDTTLNLIELSQPAETNARVPGGVVWLLRSMTNLWAMIRGSTNQWTGVIRDFKVTNCVMQVEDLAQLRPVRLHLDRIAMNVTNVSNLGRTAMTANIAMRCNTNGALKADIVADLLPLRAEAKLQLQNVDLAPASPYAGQYLGYQLKQGALSLDLRCHVAERKLKSQNRIVIDQLQLGEQVDSSDAARLPIRLTIAILKDRQGKIEFEFPIEGNLDDSDFHLGSVISRAIANKITQIVTSPFALLGISFGGQAEELSFQEFAPGSTQLPSANRIKLDALAKALYAHPELHLEIGGAEAWKTQVARRNENNRAGEKGAGALMRMSKPLGKTTPTNNQDQLLATLETTPGDVQTLSAERARSVKEYLLGTGKIEAERISLANATLAIDAPDNRVYFRLK